MALVNIETIGKKISAMLAKLDAPQGFEILSYKRNRGIAVLLRDRETVWVREHGYREEEQEVGLEELPKLLKTLIKREFPRSRKLRVYQIAGPEELNQPRKKL